MVTSIKSRLGYSAFYIGLFFAGPLHAHPCLNDVTIATDSHLYPYRVTRSPSFLRNCGISNPGQ